MIPKRNSIQRVLLAIAIAMYIYMPVYTLSQQRSDNDFKHIYLGMKALLDGNTPYPIQSLQHQASLQGFRQLPLNPYVYLPFTGYSMAFLAPFSLPQASWIWFGLNHCFALASIALLARQFPQWRIGAFAVLMAALAWNVPFYITLSAGQLSVALLFLLSAAIVCLETHRTKLGSVLLGFSAMYKLQPALYGPYLLLRKQYRSLIIMMTTAFVLLFISTLTAGKAVSTEFLTILNQMSYGKSTWPWANSFWNDPSNQSLNSFFSHIFTKSDHTKPWVFWGQSTANAFTLGFTLLLIAIWVGVTIARSRHQEFELNDALAFSSTLILSLLIPSLMWDHYLVMLFLPLTYMVSAAIKMRQWFILLTIGICYGITAMPWDFANPKWQHGIGIILMSLKLWPTLILFGLSLCLLKRQSRYHLESH